MNEREYKELREQSWRRRLTPSEDASLQRFLAVHPEAQEDWLTETELNRLLQRLPDAPVPSNFTARVLQATRYEAAVPAEWNWPAWFKLGKWLPRTAVATFAVGILLSIGYHEHQARTREDLAQSVMQLSDAVTASDPELMQDFEPIRRLSEPQQPKADIELIALMK